MSNVSNITNNNLIKTVGIIFDETYFHEKEALIRELVERVILEKDIEILIFRDIIKIRASSIFLIIPINFTPHFFIPKRIKRTLY